MASVLWRHIRLIHLVPTAASVVIWWCFSIIWVAIGNVFNALLTMGHVADTSKIPMEQYLAGADAATVESIATAPIGPVKIHRTIQVGHIPDTDTELFATAIPLGLLELDE